jgi:cytidylate kinase
VTISALYGAGGSVIAPAVAERLGVPFLGRPALPEQPECETAERGGGLLTRIASLASAWGTPAGMTLDDLMPDQAEREALEAQMRELAAGGDGVILGRAAIVVLRDHPGTLHVLLDGPRDARVEQAMRIEGVDRATAAERLERVDRFRRAYVHDLYGVEPREFAHLVIDSTALALDTCVDVIVRAAQDAGLVGAGEAE